MYKGPIANFVSPQLSTCSVRAHTLPSEVGHHPNSDPLLVDPGEGRRYLFSGRVGGFFYGPADLRHGRGWPGAPPTTIRRAIS